MGFTALSKMRNKVVFAPKDIDQKFFKQDDVNELIEIGYTKLEAIELLDVLSHRTLEVDEVDHYEYTESDH